AASLKSRARDGGIPRISSGLRLIFSDEPCKMMTQNRTGPRGTHNVLRLGHDLHHLIAIRSQVLVAAEVHVFEPQNVAEFVRQHMRREVVWAQGNSAAGHVG